MEERIGTFSGVSVHLPCLVVYLYDNQIKICCKLLTLYLFSSDKKIFMTGKLASFFEKTIEAKLNLCLTVYFCR